MCVDVEVICILHVQALCMCFAVIVYCRMHVWYRTYHVVPQRTHTLASLELVFSNYRLPGAHDVDVCLHGVSNIGAVSRWVRLKSLLSYSNARARAMELAVAVVIACDFGQTCSSMSLECKTVWHGYAIQSDLIGICFVTPALARREPWAMELVMVATYYCWYFCNGHGIYKII